MSEARGVRPPRPIHFEGRRTGSKELGERFATNEDGMQAEDIAAVAKKFLEQMHEDRLYHGGEVGVYVIEGLLNKVVENYANIRHHDDPQITASLDQIRTAVIEKIKQYLTEQPNILPPEQLYVLTQVLSRNTYSGVDNVWLADHTNGPAVVKFDTTGLKSEDHRRNYQTLRTLLAAEPNTHLRMLATEYSPEGRTAIGEPLQFHTLTERLKDPTFSLRDSLQAMAQTLDGVLHLLRHRFMLSDIKSDNIGIDQATREAFLFDFGMVNQLDSKTIHSPSVLNIACQEIGRVLFTIQQHYIKQGGLEPGMAMDLQALIARATGYGEIDLVEIAEVLNRLVSKLDKTTEK